LPAAASALTRLRQRRHFACGGAGRGFVVDVVQGLFGVVQGLHNIGIGECGERPLECFEGVWRLVGG
jgi:hypothetical protein